MRSKIRTSPARVLSFCGALLLVGFPLLPPVEASDSEGSLHPRRQQRLERLEQRRSGTVDRTARWARQWKEIGRAEDSPATPDKFSPVDGAFQVNTVITGPQGIPDVARLPTGEFVVVWQSFYSSGDDTDQTSINGRLFAADGTPLGNEFQVNTTTSGYQGYSSVAIAPNGFVVAWESVTDVDRSVNTEIRARRFGGDGTPQGNDFQVNTFETDQYRPRVAMRATGDFVVVWDSYGSPDSDSDYSSIQARRFAANGTPLGNQFQVNSFETSYQYDPDIAVTSSGEFLVVWDSGQSPGTDNSSYSILARRVLDDGSTVAPDFQVNTLVNGPQVYPRVGTDGSSFIVVWEGEDSASSDPDISIQGQRLDAIGGFVGGQFQVNSDDDGIQADADITVTPAGDFAVSWNDYGALFVPEDTPRPKVDPLAPSLEMRRFDANATPLAAEFAVSSSDAAFYGAIAGDEIGNIVGVWEQVPELVGEDEDGSSSSTVGQLLQLDADLQITLVPQGQATPGGILVYLLTASNGGPDGISAADVNASFDPDLTCTWTSLAQGGSSGNGAGAGDITEVLNLPAGTSVVYTITCDVDINASGDLVSNSSVTARITDLMPGNESAASVLPIAPQVPFALDIPVLDPRGLALLLLLLAATGVFVLRR